MGKRRSLTLSAAWKAEIFEQPIDERRLPRQDFFARVFRREPLDGIDFGEALLAAALRRPFEFEAIGRKPRRIEIAFPVIEPRLQANLKDFLELQLADTVKSWWMQPDGDYIRTLNRDLSGLRFQERFYEILQAENRPSAIKEVAA